MFELAYPWLLAALPAPLLVRWLLPPHRQRVASVRVPFFQQLVRAAGLEARPGATVLNRKTVQIVTMSLVWVCLVVGVARPEWVGDPIVHTEASRDIMLAVDLSGSMGFVDFPAEDGTLVRRLDAVQRVIDRFVVERDGDRVGLIVFGDRAYLQLPFTRDLATAGELVALMDVAMAGPRTALGDAIGLSIHTFETSALDERLLILLTDGNDTASKMTPINAAEIARLSDVEIYTIGVGDPMAAGEDRVDFKTLALVAERTGGQFFKAEDEAGLREVYTRIDELSTGEVKTQSWRPRDSLVHWPTGLAVILSVVTAALALGRQKVVTA